MGCSTLSLSSHRCFVVSAAFLSLTHMRETSEGHCLRTQPVTLDLETHLSETDPELPGGHWAPALTHGDYCIAISPEMKHSILEESSLRHRIS